ncbi:hypothetical protein Tco_1226948 [Tanacetum coccineum]
MFEVSIILKDDSSELVFRGANGLVNVSLSNSETSSFVSTFVELSGKFVASLFGEVLGEGVSLSIEVEEEEDALAVSGGGRVAVEMGLDATLRFLKSVIMHLKSDFQALAYLRLSLGHGTSTEITVVVRICPGGTTMVDVSLEEEGGMVFLPS